MKKIFIPALTLLLTAWAMPSHAQYAEPTYVNGRCVQGCPEEDPALFEDIFDKPNKESYWKNRFRSYRVYSILAYPQASTCNDVGAEDIQTVNAHEYKHNVVVSANKGQRMYDSTTYTLRTHTINGEAYRVNTKGIISNKYHDFRLNTDDLLRPFGEVNIDEQTFMLLRINNTSYTLLIDEAGNIHNRMGIVNKNKLYLTNEPMVYSPDYLRIIPLQNTSQSVSDTHLNFDIRYDGIENNMLVFLIYNADTGTTTKRVASPSQRFVSINGVNFEIIYYTPEYIEYRIN